MQSCGIEQVRLISNAGDAAVSAGTLVAGDAVDTNGFEDATFAVEIATANAGNKLVIQQSDTTTAGDFTDLVGAEAVAASNGQQVAVCVRKPAKRYLRATVVRSGTNTATGQIACILGNPRLAPAAQPGLAPVIVTQPTEA